MWFARYCFGLVLGQWSSQRLVAQKRFLMVQYTTWHMSTLGKGLKPTPHCQRYHIPSKNMTWVEDLFAKLKINTKPWPRPYRDGGIPRIRWMSPGASILASMDDTGDKGEDKRYKILAILVCLSWYSTASPRAGRHNHPPLPLFPLRGHLPSWSLARRHL